MFKKKTRMSEFQGDPFREAETLLGRNGRILPFETLKKPTVWKNAVVATPYWGRIWAGDLDIEARGDKLTALAKEIDDRVYVLRESDAWEGLNFSRAVAVFGDES